jgi:pentatricopeptide repeat protein
MRHWSPDWELPEQELAALAESLSDAGQWEEAVELWSELVKRRPGESDAVRVRAAEVLIECLHRPQAALKLLQPLSPGLELQAQVARLRREALRLIDEGVVEFDRSG